MIKDLLILALPVIIQKGNNIFMENLAFNNVQMEQHNLKELFNV